MKYRNKEHTDRVFAETARRLGLTTEAFMDMPVIEVAKLMAERNVTMGLQLVR